MPSGECACSQIHYKAGQVKSKYEKGAIASAWIPVPANRGMRQSPTRRAHIPPFRYETAHLNSTFVTSRCLPFVPRTGTPVPRPMVQSMSRYQHTP